MRYVTIFLLLLTLACGHSWFKGLPKQERAVVEEFDRLAYALMDSGYVVAIGRGVSAREGLSEKEARVTGRAALLDMVDSVLQDIHRQAADLRPEKMDSLSAWQQVPEDYENDPKDLGMGFADKFEVIRCECLQDEQGRYTCYALVQVTGDSILTFFKDRYDIQRDDVSFMISSVLVKELYTAALAFLLEMK